MLAVIPWGRREFKLLKLAVTRQELYQLNLYPVCSSQTFKPFGMET